MPRTTLTLPEPRCCKNCAHLCWGQSEGADICEVDGTGVAWAAKGNTICERYILSPYPDPRVHKDLLTEKEKDAARFEWLMKHVNAPRDVIDKQMKWEADHAKLVEQERKQNEPSDTAKTVSKT
jgi:hypothetical protein